MCRQDAAVARYEAQLMLRQLARSALATNLDHRFGDRRHPPHVKRTELSSPRVHRNRTAWTRFAIGYEWTTLALLAEAIIFEGHQNGEGIAIIKLGKLDVGQLYVGHLEGGFLRDGSAREQRVHRIAARMSLAHPEQIYRRLLQILRALRRGDDHGASAVGHQTAIVQMERLGDPSRMMIVLQRHRLVVELRLGIAIGPLALLDRDRAELVLRRAVHVHMTPRDEGIVRIDAELPVCGIEPARESVCRRGAAAGALRVLGSGRFEGSI